MCLSFCVVLSLCFAGLDWLLWGSKRSEFLKGVYGEPLIETTKSRQADVHLFLVRLVRPSRLAGFRS